MNTNCWADGFGRWHASVPLTDSRSKDSRKARALIQEALTEREGPNFDPDSVHVRRERATANGAVVYREHY